MDGISIFRKHKIGKVSFSESETIKPSLSWAVNAGFKYKLAKHLFFIADMSLIVGLLILVHLSYTGYCWFVSSLPQDGRELKVQA